MFAERGEHVAPEWLFGTSPFLRQVIGRTELHRITVAVVFKEPIDWSAEASEPKPSELICTRAQRSSGFIDGTGGLIVKQALNAVVVLAEEATAEVHNGEMVQEQEEEKQQQQQASNRKVCRLGVQQRNRRAFSMAFCNSPQPAISRTASSRQ